MIDFIYQMYMISGNIMCTENVYFMSMTNKDHVHDVKIKSPTVCLPRVLVLLIVFFI